MEIKNEDIRREMVSEVDKALADVGMPCGYMLLLAVQDTSPCLHVVHKLDGNIGADALLAALMEAAVQIMESAHAAGVDANALLKLAMDKLSEGVCGNA